MAKGKSGSNNKITFGKRKGGRYRKTRNKHDRKAR